MSQLGTAYVQIVPSAQGISGKIQNVINPEASAAGVSAGNKIAGGMKQKLSKISGGLFKAGAIATAVSVPIVAGIKKSLEAYQVQNGAETKLTEIYKTRMGATKQAAKETMKLASALQQEGVVGDEVALSGAQQLATFAKYPGTVNKLMPAMENLLVQQKGLNGTAEDATSIANLMGKVMQGQTGALKRVGISFTEAEEKVLKYGTEEERAAMLSKVITNNVGKMNKTMAKTPEGKIQQMKNSLGDMAEKVGAVLAPVLAKLAKWVSSKLIPKIEKFFKFLNQHPVIKKVAIALTGLAVAIGPVLIALSGIIKLMSGVGTVFKIIAGGPVTLIIAAIAALVIGFMYLWKKSKAFRDFFIKLWNGIKAVIGPIIKTIVNIYKTAFKVITTVWKKLPEVFKKIWAAIKGAFSKVGHFFKSVFTGAFNAVKSAFSKVGGFFKSVWSNIKGAFKNVVSFYKGIFTRAWAAIKRVFSGWGKFFSGLWDKIKNKFKNIGSALGGAIGKAVKAGINGVLKTIEKVINGAISLINKAIDIINKIPKVDIPHIKKVSLPRLAQGGVLKRGQVGVLEGSGAEAVVPLEKNKEWISRVADDMKVSLGSGNQSPGKTVNITINNKIDGAEKPEEYAVRLVRQLKVEMRTI